MGAFKFRIGQKVACIGVPEYLRVAASRIGVTVPITGGVYTIRGRDYFPLDIGSGDWNGKGYLLEEIVNPPVNISITHGYLRMEGHFNEEFFRPLVDTSKTIEELRKLQDPANHQNLGDGDFVGVPTRKKEKAA